MAQRIAWAGVGMWLLLSGMAVAADDVEAMISRGVALRREGRDADALVEFRNALKIQKTPRIQAQVALAEQALGLWSAAESDLQEALENNDDRWIKKNRDTLQRALAIIGTHLGSLTVWGTPKGAAVFANEKPVGSLPLEKPLRVAGETVALRIHAAGFMENRRTVRVPAGEVVREFVELVPEPPEPVAAKPARKTPVKLEPMLASADVARGSDEREQGAGAGKNDLADRADAGQPAPGSSRLRPWAWAAAVGAVGGLAWGGVETLLALKNQNTFNDFLTPDPNDPSRQIHCDADNLNDACRPLSQAYNQNVRLAVIGYAVGGVLAIGSAILFVASRPSISEGQTHVGLACAPALDARGLFCHLTF